MISKITLGYGIFIVLSASFMQQVWVQLEHLIGKDILETSCILFLLATATFAIGWITVARNSVLRLVVGVVVLSLGFLFALNQSIMVEKMHVLEYGFLGWFSLRDLNKRRPFLKVIFPALLFVLIISILDEGFQRLLPYRFGQIRDVLLNVVSSLFGMTLFAIHLPAKAKEIS